MQFQNTTKYGIMKWCENEMHAWVSTSSFTNLYINKEHFPSANEPSSSGHDGGAPSSCGGFNGEVDIVRIAW